MNADSQGKPISILLADDHVLFRDALIAYLERALPLAHVVTVDTLVQAREKLVEEEQEFDLILLDWHMPGVRSIDDLSAIVRDYPDRRFALISGVAQPRDVWAAIESGFVGFIPKTLTGGLMTNAVNRILSGQTYIPMDPETVALFQSYRAEKSAYLPMNMGAVPPLPGLTPREDQTLRHLLAGRTNAEIADEMGLSVATVKMHLRHAFEKLDVRNRTEAVLKCREIGMIEG